MDWIPVEFLTLRVVGTDPPANHQLQFRFPTLVLVPVAFPVFSTLLKGYLQQFLLPRISCLDIKAKKKSQGILKGKKQFEETEQSSEPNVTGVLELSGQEFKTTMMNMLRALIDKVGSMQEQMGRASLVAQWLRICLPMQGTRVRALVWEDPTCHGATGPVSHNY